MTGKTPILRDSSREGAETLFNSRVEALFSSLEYKKELSKLLSAITEKTTTTPNEASLLSIFETELHHFIRGFFSVDIKFEKEVGATFFRHQFKGRVDALCNDLIIEYKHSSKMNSEADKTKATLQVQSYIEQLVKAGKQYRAVLTDGNKIKHFYFRNNVLECTPFSTIGIDDLDNIIKSLLLVNYKKFAPENIAKDFSLNATNAYTKDLAVCLFQFLGDSKITEKTSMLYNEWEELFHLSESDQGKNADIEKRRRALSNIFGTEINNNDLEYKSLFALQTTYAIIVKLIACKTISKLAFKNDIIYFSDLTTTKPDELQQFLEKLEDGYVFSNAGIINLLEGDFFSWYCSEYQWNSEEAKIIKNIIKTLEEYTTISFTHKYEVVDIFKDLYMEIMPSEVRHSFGEYFTPAWLADHVVKNSIAMVTKKEWRAIDPCGGSGIFIVSLIKNIIGDIDVSKLTPSEKDSLLSNIINRVIGIDINPLSVLTARVSYFLAISMLKGNSKIEIPIYLGDSASVPNIINMDGVDCYEYNVTTKKGIIHVSLPCSFVKSPKFIEVMGDLQYFIKIEDVNLVYDHFTRSISDSDKNSTVLKALKALSEQLVYLHVNRWDGIWIRIITNFMLVAKIQNIDIIVGNPPWIKWEYLPQNYAEKIKSTCVDRHLFSGQSYMGAISLNICALIANVTASSWLNQEGLLAFLMPKTLMTQDSYAGFRNFYIDYNSGKRLFLQKVDDWSKAGDPFIETKEKFLTYYYKADKVDYCSSGVPIKYIIKKKKKPINEINRYREWGEVASSFDFQYGTAYQFDKQRTGFTLTNSNDTSRIIQFRNIIGKCEYKARSGVEFTPAEIYFIKPVSSTSNAGAYIFKNSEFTSSIYKAINKNEFELETKYIRPVLKSPCIERFKIVDSDNYCIFPYNNGVADSVSIGDLSRDCMSLTRYLLDYKTIIEKQSSRSKGLSKGNDFYALSKVGAYTFSENIVAFRDNTKLVSAVVKPIVTPWGEISVPICAKHSPYISMDKTNRYITENEAYYICGILNTLLVQEYFKFTYSGRSYSIDFNIKLPLYDETVPNHKKICELSKQAHKEIDIEKIENIALEIEHLYLDICREV